MVIFNILVFLISLSVVIMIHELGHFVMARRAGILCHEFAIGMGPTVWSKRKGETLYSIKLIPIGGYVMMSGEEIEDEVVKVGSQVRLVFEQGKVTKIILDHTDEKYERYEKITVEKVDLKGQNMAPLYINDYEVVRNAFYVMKNREYQVAPVERGFNGKTLWQRFKAIFFGPAMNFALALVVYLIVNLAVGFPNMGSTILGTVGDEFPAGGKLQVGDEIIAIEGVEVDSWEELSLELEKDFANRELDITFIRDGEEMQTTITPMLYFYSFGFHSAIDAGDSLIIGSVTEETKAGSAGFEAGDQILSVDGNLVASWTEFIAEIERIGDLPYLEGRVIEFVVSRDGNEVTLSVDEPFSEAFLETQNIGIVESRIGISPEYNFNFGQAIISSFKDVGRSAMIIFTTIGLLFDNSGAGAGVGVDNLAGPLGIYEITSQALSGGWITLFSWIGLLSVNLGVINLLPIPALDGGRLVFLGYEAITKRKLNRKVENTLNYVMFLALMGLFVFITYNDLLRLLNIK